MKQFLLPVLCSLALTACASSAPEGSTKVDVTAKTQQQEAFEITGKVYDMNNVPNPPIVPNDPRVSVYKTDGPLINPLNEDRTHSVLENTTSGGYTVFDESVRVYPLPGNDTPDYLPTYAVPPLEGQYAQKQPKQGIGEPMGLASAGILPPVQNVEVRSVPRKPMSLTAPEPLTMQPPVADTAPPMKSPFDGAGNVKTKPRAPSMLTGIDNAPMPQGAAIDPDAAFIPPSSLQTQAATVPMDATPSAPSPASTMKAGRRSSPLLTGY